ncbi:transporter substrate-binding domain-containing protein [Azospirillum canadense]|uniref:transporter substrate-binding domain-containing protein n=1 Tax=Azospirillum canadense TaxID=403962 RepID=UPI002227D111|nr:transporter substrate-binding domain-containing protein [Azospirillum canadense]MCW2240015.1 polar amino acid transport system substrate-binding protein [Azospirillum canadense]
MGLRSVAALFLILLCGLSSGEAAADRLDLIRKRGTLMVGVKGDYPPFGMLDIDGGLVGFEPDLAWEIAKALDVQLQLVGVNSANRLQKLEEGSVDLIIATLGDTAQRRQLTTIIEPDYYASGVNLLMPLDTPMTDWADLRGRTICATQGALFNRPMAQRYLLDLKVFNGTRDAKLALRDRRCVGWLYDDTAIASDLFSPEWKGYGMPLASSMPLNWGMAIAMSEHGTAYERTLSDMVADWHRSGLLIEIERRWNLKPSAFLSGAHELWQRRGPNGKLLCTRQPDGEWPAECRNKAVLTSTDVGGLHRAGLLMKELTGLNVTIVYDDYDRGHFLHGLLVTLELIALCLAGSLLVGVAGAITVEARIPLLSRAVKGLATFARMTPPLLQVYVVFFGIGSVVVRTYGWTFDGVTVTALCLSLYAGAANLFAFLEAAAHVREHEAGFRLHPSSLRSSLPAALRVAYGPLVATLVNVVKATGMASAIGVPELISSSAAIVADQGNAGVMMNVLMVTYFLIVLLVVRLFGMLERRMVRHGTA